MIGKKIVANNTRISNIGNRKVKKTLEGHLIFDEKGFEFKKGIGEALQFCYDDIRINYCDIQEVKPINYGPLHTIMIVVTKDGQEYRFGSYRRAEVMEFLNKKKEG